MDWISLAIAIALLVVAVYSESHTSEKKKQSAVYLGDSALFTIILLTRTAKNGLRAFLVVNGQKGGGKVHRKPPETRLIYFTHMHGYAHHRIAGDFSRKGFWTLKA